MVCVRRRKTLWSLRGRTSALRFCILYDEGLPVRLRFSLAIGGALAVALASAIVGACAAPNLDEGENVDLPLPDRVLPPADDAAQDSGPAVQDAADAGDGEGGEGGDAGPLHAFVSSAVINAALGGLAGADKTCNDLATAQGLPGTYRAWLSIAGTEAKDRVTSAGPWVRVDGVVAIASRAQLLGGNIATSMALDEKGNKASVDEDRVWTATLPDGTYSGPDCNLWTGMGMGRVGEAEFTDNRWSNSTIETCDMVNRIYCFQL